MRSRFDKRVTVCFIKKETMYNFLIIPSGTTAGVIREVRGQLEQFYFSRLNAEKRINIAAQLDRMRKILPASAVCSPVIYDQAKKQLYHRLKVYWGLKD